MLRGEEGGGGVIEKGLAMLLMALTLGTGLMMVQRLTLRPRTGKRRRVLLADGGGAQLRGAEVASRLKRPNLFCTSNTVRDDAEYTLTVRPLPGGRFTVLATQRYLGSDGLHGVLLELKLNCIQDLRAWLNTHPEMP